MKIIRRKTAPMEQAITAMVAAPRATVSGSVVVAEEMYTATVRVALTANSEA